MKETPIKMFTFTHNLKTGKTTKESIPCSKITMGKRKTEKIFNINLKGRHYTISKFLGNVEVSFFDENNIFGWLERITIKEFNKRFNLFNTNAKRTNK